MQNNPNSEPSIDTLSKYLAENRNRSVILSAEAKCFYLGALAVGVLGLNKLGQGKIVSGGMLAGVAGSLAFLGSDTSGFAQQFEDNARKNEVEILAKLFSNY